MPIEFNPETFGGPPGKKRRRPTPEFKIPSAFNPITGEYANLRVEGLYPHCAMMQVAAADTYEDYVICRGFDPRIRAFVDYAAGDANKPGISVAKPYGNRTIGAYTVAQVYPAFLPTQGASGQGGRADDYTPPSPTDVDWRVGQNAGTATTSTAVGHPTALVDEITELVDHNGKQVQWLLVGSLETTTTEHFWGKATANWTDNGASCDHVTVNPCDDCEGANPTAAVVTVLLPKAAEQDPNVIAGDVVAYTGTSDATRVCVSDYLDEKIGTVKMWALASGTVQPGWAIMNGSDNAAPAGSGIDLTDKFVRGSATASGGTGGTANHTHTYTLEIFPHTEDEIAISLDHTHGIEIFDHTVTDLQHLHPLAEDTISFGWDYSAGVADKAPFFDCTDSPKDYAGSEHDCSAGAWGPLKHFAEVKYAYGGGTIQGDKLYHRYEFEIDEEEHLPEYVELIFIERIDNSA